MRRKTRLTFVGSDGKSQVSRKMLGRQPAGASEPKSEFLKEFEKMATIAGQSSQFGSSGKDFDPKELPYNQTASRVLKQKLRKMAGQKQPVEAAAASVSSSQRTGQSDSQRKPQISDVISESYIYSTPGGQALGTESDFTELVDGLG